MVEEGVLLVSDGIRWTDPIVVAENGSDRAVGEVCACDAAEDAAYCEEPDEGGRPSASRGSVPGTAGLAGEGLRTLDRNGSSASRREGDAAGGVLPVSGEAR
jgi:hypothetical protein